MARPNITVRTTARRGGKTEAARIRLAESTKKALLTTALQEVGKAVTSDSFKGLVRDLARQEIRETIGREVGGGPNDHHVGPEGSLEPGLHRRGYRPMEEKPATTGTDECVKVGAIGAATNRIRGLYHAVNDIRDRVQSTSRKLLGSNGTPLESKDTTGPSNEQSNDLAQLFNAIDALAQQVDKLAAESAYLCNDL